MCFYNCICLTTGTERLAWLHSTLHSFGQPVPCPKARGNVSPYLGRATAVSMRLLGTALPQSAMLIWAVWDCSRLPGNGIRIWHKSQILGLPPVLHLPDHNPALYTPSPPLKCLPPVSFCHAPHTPMPTWKCWYKLTIPRAFTGRLAHVSVPVYLYLGWHCALGH